MTSLLKLSLDELLLSLKRKRIPIQFEIGTFVVLEACEAVIETPVRVGCSDVSIDDEGRVSVSELAGKASTEESTRSLIDVLCDLLLASAPGIPDTLLQLVEHGPLDEQYTLSRLKDDLEAALVPLNRSATRRVLARLAREAKKEREHRIEQPQFVASRTELDDEFDTLFSRSKKASNPASSEVIDSDQTHPRDATKYDSDNDTSDRTLLESDPDAWSKRAVIRDDSRNRDLRPNDQSPDRTDDFIEIKETEEKNLTIARLGLAVIALLLLVIGYFIFAKPNKDESRISVKIESLSANRTHEIKTARGTSLVQKAPPSRGVLRINSTPSLAQVLLYVGRGFARVERVPLGISHEFVAVADGYAPTRTVLAADAIWQTENRIPFTAMTMTLAPLTDERSASVLGSTGLPQKQSARSGKLGTVEIRTDPSDAAIYQLVGFTPDFAIEKVSTKRPIRLLVYAAGYHPKRIDIDPKEWSARGGKSSLEIEAELKPTD